MATVITTDFSCRAHDNDKFSCCWGLPTNDPSSCNYFFFCLSLDAPISLSYLPSEKNYLIPRGLVEVVALLSAMQKRRGDQYVVMQLKRHNVRKVFLYWQRGETSIDVLSPIFSIIYQNFREKRHFIVSTKDLGRVKWKHRGETNKGIEYEQRQWVYRAYYRYYYELFDVFSLNKLECHWLSFSISALRICFMSLEEMLPVFLCL